MCIRDRCPAVEQAKNDEHGNERQNGQHGFCLAPRRVRHGVGAVSYTHLDVYKRQIYPYGFAQTSGELDDALGALASVFQDMLALAQAEKKTQLLASEIEKTRRRVNALEYLSLIHI